MTRSLSTRAATVLAALGLAAGAGSVAAVMGPLHEDAAAAAPSGTLVYSVKLVPGESGGIDGGAKGFSIGDTLVNVANLRQDGKPAGRVHITETVLDKKHEGTQQIFTIWLKGGTIEAVGGGVNKDIPGAPGSSAADARAIVGGTGDYVGASGQIELSPTGKTLTVRLS